MDASPIKPQRMAASLRRVLPDDALIFTDISNSHVLMTEYYEVRQPPKHPGLLRHWYLLDQRLVLVHDVELDRARRLVGEVLIAVDRAARDVGAVAGLERARRLALNG